MDGRTVGAIPVGTDGAFELPFAYLAAYWLGWGPDGVYIAMTVSFSALAVVGAIMFQRGHWKTQTV